MLIESHRTRTLVWSCDSSQINVFVTAMISFVMLSVVIAKAQRLPVLSCHQCMLWISRRYTGGTQKTHPCWSQHMCLRSSRLWECSLPLRLQLGSALCNFCRVWQWQKRCFWRHWCPFRSRNNDSPFADLLDDIFCPSRFKIYLSSASFLQ